MKARFILLLFFLFTTMLYSQDNDSVKHMRDSILKVSEKNFNKKSKKQTSIFISLKGGHHTINWDYDGLKSSWLVGLSFGAEINNHWCLGITFDYSTSTNSEYYDDASKIIYNKNYKEYGVSIIFKYKYYFLKDKIDINAGIGLGTYSFKSNNWEGNYYDDGYLNVSVNAGIGIKILPNLSLDFDWSLYNLIIIKESRRPLVINNFKIGPTIYLYY